RLAGRACRPDRLVALRRHHHARHHGRRLGARNPPRRSDRGLRPALRHHRLRLGRTAREHRLQPAARTPGTSFRMTDLTLLETDRLVLSGWRPDQIDDLYRLHGDPTVARYLTGHGQPWTKEAMDTSLAHW